MHDDPFGGSGSVDLGLRRPPTESRAAEDVATDPSPDEGRISLGSLVAVLERGPTLQAQEEVSLARRHCLGSEMVRNRCGQVLDLESLFALQAGGDDLTNPRLHESLVRRHPYGGARSSSTDPSGRRNTGRPSSTSSLKPPARCTIRWCRRHSNNRFERAVVPPSAQCETW
jgi:hypothetical protein